MPRYARDSEEEIDTRPGRRTRLTDTASIDSPLRRSSRIKSVKQNESSPESVSSDVSNVSNTQLKVRRRRTGVMENPVITEKQRSLRSRINSASSDINESTEVNTTTSTPKRRSTIINDVLSKTDNRRGKRFTRASSESKSSSIRTTRNKRAISVEREKEENRKVLLVTLDRTLPNVNEIKEMNKNNSPKVERKVDSQSNIEDNLNIDCHDSNEKDTKNNDNENLASEPENIEKDTPTDNKNTPDNNKNMLKKSENLHTSIVSQPEPSVHDSSQSFLQKSDQNTSKELGLKIENLLSNSVEEHEEFSNKENLATNVIDDESNTTLYSPKLLSASVSNKLIKEKCKSPSNLSSWDHNSRSSESMDDATVSIKEVNVDNVANNSVVKNTDAFLSADETDTSDNMPKLAIETDSLSGSTFNMNSDRSNILNICSESSSDDSIEFVKCTDDIKRIDDNDKLIDTDTILNKETMKVYNEITMDTITSKIMQNKDDVTEVVTESCTSENVQDDEGINRTSSCSSLNSTSVMPLASSEKISTENSEFKDTNKVNVSASNTNSALESMDASMSPKNSVSANTDTDSVTNVVKNNLSPTVTEGISEKELSENNCSMSKNRSTDKLETDKQKFESIKETCDKSREGMDYDDDSNKNAVNLFQDISADEWKKKNTDNDKNLIHSISTERLDNETEAECDLVLVDKESWTPTEKEKEAFDNDLNDTTSFQTQRDRMKGQKNEEMEVDILGNDSKTKVNKDMTRNKHDIENENTTEDTEDCKGKVTSLNKSNVSENVSEKRKSLNKSVCELNNSERSNKNELVKNRKSLNKSNHKENEMTTELNTENIVITSANKVKEKRSLNNSLRKQINRIEDSDSEFNDYSVHKKENSATKNNVRRNRLQISSIESDSDNTRSNSDNSQNKSMKLPKFLFAEASNSDSSDGNKSDSTMNSDIEREYNLHGKDISKFSDDDVPGDECRASETESSDPDDNGSDLADFVVDDDISEDEEEGDEDEGEDEGEEEEEEEDKEGEGGEKEEEEEEDNEKIENVDTEEDEEEEIMQMEESNKSEKKIKESIITDTQNETEEQNNEEIVDESVDTFDKENSKLNSSKKIKRKKRNTSLSGKSDKEYSLSDLSLSNSFKIKKRKQKRVSNEFTVEDIKQPLNDSELIFNKKEQKQLSKSMECSTPKNHFFKSEALDVDIKSLNASDSNINTRFSKKTKIGMVSKTKDSFKKLNKVKSEQNFADTCLSSESIELVEKMNFSKPSKVAKLNKTTSIPDSETPTTKYLRKEKLNESAPTLKLDTQLEKLINVDDGSEQDNTLNQVKKQIEVDDTSNVEAAQELNASLKRKTSDIPDVDRRKRRKLRKQRREKNNHDMLVAGSLDEDVDSQIQNENEHIVSIGNTDQIEEFEETSVNEEKKKKKKQKRTRTGINKPTEEEFVESEITKKSVPKKVKKKQKKEIIENVSDIYSDRQLPETKRKISPALSNEEITVTKKSKKKQKLSSPDNTLSNNETVVEKLSKKRKELASEDVTSQREEVPSKKLSKKKRTLLSDDVPQSEDISTKKLSKKKNKLLLKNERKNKVKATKASNKLQQVNNMSDSDEGPVQFSEARDEELKVTKRTADGTKVNKEMRKKKRKEHAEEIRSEEIENKNLKLKKQEMNTNKTELQKRSIKRLPDEVLENLSDIPVKPLKKRKVSKTEEQILPSQTMFNSKAKDTMDTYTEDLVQPSYSGSTTQFAVVNIKKMKKKKVSNVNSFKQKMLARNSRQPVSAYLMYLAKQKVSSKDRFCNKPY